MAAVDVYTGHHRPSPAGRLSASQQQYHFSYRHDAPEALSLTMPLRHESYSHAQLHPIFQMNLPEGALREALERMTAKQYGSDDLTLLTILGTHQIGRMAYALADQPLPTPGDKPLGLDDLLHSHDANLFGELLQRYAQQSGVAGVQPKILLDLQGHLTFPLEHYIVKSWGADYPHLGCNEYLCMSIAKDAGLSVPVFHLSDNAKLLISQRFDIDSNGEALGFEDFCVLQAKGTKQKYDSSLESCANTIRQFVSTEHQAQALADWYKLSYLNVRLRNGDAHLKNLGVLYRDLHAFRRGEVPSVTRTLAPVFDLVSTVPYLPHDTMALTLTGSKRWPKRKVLQAFAKQHCQLAAQQIGEIEAAVEQAIRQNLPLLERLQQQYAGFAPIGEGLHTLLLTPLP
ncbi:type II toxin-antitoxin system HipA family toxin [Thiothrix lacustris]|uniref:type II toxin-antitoxin system HipA family toxin n=1 Tax=Thiothrix lacustris TaxID=525917 RepID=UPI0027E4AAC1|nr:type II toxin-antitoxin system HipA family toxin [Thiothrix lacustris]WMP15890.1 type II toxin-antitoxin system HipA family toxin [Thiothrix lacustris]